MPPTKEVIKLVKQHIRSTDIHLLLDPWVNVWPDSFSQFCSCVVKKPSFCQYFYKYLQICFLAERKHGKRTAWNCKMARDHSFSEYGKFFRKTNISYPLIRTRTCAYQGVRNASFSENLAYVLNEWSPIKLTMIIFSLHGGSTSNMSIWDQNFLEKFFFI